MTLTALGREICQWKGYRVEGVVGRSGSSSNSQCLSESDNPAKIGGIRKCS